MSLELAGHQRGRALRQAHAARGGQYFGTVIHHARSRNCALVQRALALAKVAITIAVILTDAGRGLARRTNYTELQGAYWLAAVIAAVGLPVVIAAIAAAHLEQAVTNDASLEAKQ